MNIRNATLDDTALLISLRIDYLIEDRGHLSDEEEQSIRSQLTTYIAQHIGRDFIAILAESDGQVVSTAFLTIAEKPANPAFITGKTGTLLNVLTYPEYRRRGIAAEVVRQIIREAKQKGVSYIELSATEDGKYLYEKLGFSEFKSHYTPMRLQLV